MFLSTIIINASNIHAWVILDYRAIIHLFGFWDTYSKFPSYKWPTLSKTTYHIPGIIDSHLYACTLIPLYTCVFVPLYPCTLALLANARVGHICVLTVHQQIWHHLLGDQPHSTLQRIWLNIRQQGYQERIVDAFDRRRHIHDSAKGVEHHNTHVKSTNPVKCPTSQSTTNPSTIMCDVNYPVGNYIYGQQSYSRCKHGRGIKVPSLKLVIITKNSTSVIKCQPATPIISKPDPHINQ